MNKTKKIISFIGLTIAMFMGTLDSTIVNIALPDIMKQFNASLNDTSWITTIYTLALAVFMITGSKLADQYGRKKVMLIGLAIFGGFSAACMFAPNLLSLIAFRFFQGIGGAIITPIVLPMGVEIFGKENTSKISSVVGAITALAAAGGPPIGGILLQVSSWRAVFGINVPLALVAGIIIVAFVGESYDDTLTGKVDWWGMLTLSLGLGGIVFGLLEGRQFGWSSLTIISSLVVGVIALIGFYLIEKHVSSPLVELNLLKEKTLTASGLVYFVTGFSLVCPMLIINYFLQDVLNYKPLHAALIIIPVSLTVMIAMPLGTKILDAMGAKIVTFMGLILIAASLGLLSLVKTNTPTIIIIVFLIINGFGFGFSSVSLVASVKYLPKAKTGVGSGLVNALRQIGTCLGVALLVTVLNNNVSDAKHELKTNSIQIVKQHQLSPHVKEVAINEINGIFSGKSTKVNTKSLTKNIKKAATKTTNLPAPKANSSLSKLYDAQKQLSAGNRNMSRNLNKLNAGVKNTPAGAMMKPLVKGSDALANGSDDVLTGIKLLAQKQELQSALNTVKKQKNKKITKAFSNSYLLAAIIVLIASPITWWTDRKGKQVNG